MDMRDIYEVGSDIMEAVNDAVGSGDFSKLNESLRNVTGTAAGTAADALYGLQGKLQGEGQGWSRGDSGNPPEERVYGHAGRASGNVTEEYMNRAAGARHHTSYTSKMSPFLQRKVSRGSGNGKIAGGIACLAVAAFSFLDSVVTGVMGLFFGGVFSAIGITSLVVTLGLAILGGVLIRSGKERKKLVREYYEYGKVAGTAEYLEISKLAHAMGESRETVLANLEKMISEDMLPAAWFDRQKTTLMLSEDMYNEYLRLERERQAQQAEEEKAKMAARTQYGTDAYASPGPAAAETGLDDDLKPLPEDAKLPEEARKIVEEGLLYMSRIRAFNRDIADEEISAQLAHLEITMKRIIEQIRKDPSSAPNLRRLMVYYLPTTMKLLQAYRELDRQPTAGENIVSTKREIREALGTINTAFENLLDSLFQDMAWDISSDISVMKTMMAQDGLTGNQMRKPAAAPGAPGPAAAAGVPAQEPAPAMQSAPAEQPAFTEGYTEGYTEYGTSAGTAAAQMAAAPAEETEEQGIRLKFGE